MGHNSYSTTTVSAGTSSSGVVQQQQQQQQQQLISNNERNDEMMPNNTSGNNPIGSLGFEGVASLSQGGGPLSAPSSSGGTSSSDAAYGMTPEQASREFDLLRREATKLERLLEDKVARYQQVRLFGRCLLCGESVFMLFLHFFSK